MADIFDEALRLALEAGEQEAIRRSSGNEPRDDHPFAKRHGTPQADPSIANYVSGQLSESWEKDQHGAEGQLRNDSPHADFVANLEEKNKFTFARPEFQQGIEDFIEKRMEQEAIEAIEKHYAN